MRLSQQYEASRKTAREAYARQFHASGIFSAKEAAPPASGRKSMPQGRRRDQTSHEMFGSVEPTDMPRASLQRQLSTFVPREDFRTARERCIEFNSSSPNIISSDYPTGKSPMPTGGKLTHLLPLSAETAEDVFAENFGQRAAVDPLASYRAKQYMGEQLSSASSNWMTHRNATSNEGPQYSPRDKARLQNDSELFGLSPSPVPQKDTKAEAAEKEATQRRRSNPYFSDLFGVASPPSLKETGMFGDQAMVDTMKADKQVTIYNDWMDSRTEIARRLGTPQPETAGTARQRKMDETYGHRVPLFSESMPPPKDATVSKVTGETRAMPRIDLNATAKEKHQTFLQSTMLGKEFYDTASKVGTFEVVNLNLMGLKPDTTEEDIKQLTRSCGVHTVKIITDTDPVNGRSKGRARVVIREVAGDTGLDKLTNALQSMGIAVREVADV
ncbi:unnamed protein product [Vitrella brassicaformis CCMP3155]|uniref:RRM domain-containing protein n=2 Tax=Vitrella brassicaformis TaxID=1169539 RepID=A0A0G4EU25_VITBC|nr:unnamed protein product [Vitrella brassicaformis CCMP3155]|mmetsp:Transcript_5603/g.13342  ORF Transcript_5603/g.13342 Transcript_5603/m.13342 type:complete len:443 (+) Transcript_5603:77-1405(+)|eukprot:CEM02138.1 unnamed protein product [Vitrella brassicaformis CCMP3155]